MNHLCYKSYYAVFFFLLLLNLPLLKAQEKLIGPDAKIVRLIADRILKNTTYDFITRDDKKIIKTVGEADTIHAENLLIRSPYNAWTYWNGVLNVSMLRIATTLTDTRYQSFAVNNYHFAFNNTAFFKKRYTGKRRWDFPFATLFTTKELDDCGAMTAGLIEVNRLKPHPQFQQYIDSVNAFVKYKLPRLPDGTIMRDWPHKQTLWADDLYMSVLFLSRMGYATGEHQYFDEAVKQVNNFTNYLFDKRINLYYHCWYSDVNTNGVAHWGRCNGWVMMAIVELLNSLPTDYVNRDNLIGVLRQHILGISRYQDVSGMWHQIIDKSDAYLETSSTAMFTYSIAKAVNMGWIDKSYISIALEGWNGVKRNINNDGQVRNICMGTGIEENLVYYYTRPTPLNDIHGLGAILLAGDEIIKYKRSVVPE